MIDRLMRWWADRLAYADHRRAMCAYCRERPRDPANTVDRRVRAALVVDPVDYCSPECATEANACEVW